MDTTRDSAMIVNETGHFLTYAYIFHKNSNIEPYNSLLHVRYMRKRNLSLWYILKSGKIYVNSLLQGLVLISIARILRSYMIQRANARGTLKTEISQGNQEKVQCDTRSLMSNYLHVYYTWSSLFTIENLRWTYSWISPIWQMRKENGMIRPMFLRNVQFR